MEELAKAIGEVGGSLAVLIVVLIFAWRIGAKLVDRLITNLDASVQVQADVAKSILAMAENIKELAGEISSDKIETAATEAAIAKVLGKLSAQLQTHEGRAVDRHEQQMTQAAERHMELMGVLRSLTVPAAEK